MAKYTGPVCRLCRRENDKLFLKGERCNSPKCSFERRPIPPGMHGRGRRRKFSEYGIQLREKQKLKRIYGLLESQFHIFFERANKQKGVTGENLLIMLESRFDNVVYKASLASSRAKCRQMVNHSMFNINGKKVNIASYIIKQGDVISCHTDSAKKLVKESFDSLGDGFVPPDWMEIDKQNLTVKIIRNPTRSDISVQVNESLIVELYSK